MSAPVLRFFPLAKARRASSAAEQLPLLFHQPRKPVQHPGSRGGRGWFDERGDWQYGSPPAGAPETGVEWLHQKALADHQRALALRRAALEDKRTPAERVRKSPRSVPGTQVRWYATPLGGGERSEVMFNTRREALAYLEGSEGRQGSDQTIRENRESMVEDAAASVAEYAAKLAPPAAPEPEQREWNEEIDGVPTIVRTGSPDDPFKYRSSFHVTMAYDAEGYPAESRKLHAATLEEYRALLASRQPPPPEPEPAPAPVPVPEEVLHTRATEHTRRAIAEQEARGPIPSMAEEAAAAAARADANRAARRAEVAPHIAAYMEAHRRFDAGDTSPPVIEAIEGARRALYDLGWGGENPEAHLQELRRAERAKTDDIPKLERELARLQARMAPMHRRAASRAQATTREANLGKLAQVVDAVRDRLTRARAAQPPAPAEPPVRKPDPSGAPVPLPGLNDLYQIFREVGWDPKKARPLVHERFPGAMAHHEGERRWRGAVQQWGKPGPTELEEAEARLAAKVAEPQPEPVPEPEPNVAETPPISAPSGDPALAAKLHTAADALQPQIDRLYNPAIGQQNITARRSRIAGGMAERAQGLERQQRILHALAEHHAAGTVPPEVAGIRSRTHVEAALHQRFPEPHLHPAHLPDVAAGARAHGLDADAATIAAGHVAMLAHAPAGDEWKGGYNPPADLVAAVERVVKHDQAHPRTNKYGHREKLWADQILGSVREHRRMVDAGLDTPEKHAAARAALLAMESPPPPDPQVQVKAAERELLGREIPGFFPTPRAAAEAAVRAAEIGPGMTVLEPSAGKGDMAQAIRDLHPDAQITAVELQRDLAHIANLRGIPTEVGDIHAHQGGPYDRVVMNPPFERGQDMEHVQHAYSLLKPGGVLSAIMSEGPFFREDKAARSFRDWVARQGGRSEPMPEGSFMRHETSDRTTGVRTRQVTIHKPVGLLAKARAILARLTGSGPGPVRHVAQRSEPPPSAEATLARWHAREAELEKTLWYLDNEDLPVAVPGTFEHARLIKARSAASGELRALQGALVKARALHGRRRVGGLHVSIENRKGSTREWTDHATGTTGRTPMPAPYGYLRGTIGLDGEHVDVFLGPLAHDARIEGTDVYVVLTARPPFFDQPDEQKVMLGFPSWPDARRVFLAAYGGEPRFIAAVDVVPFADFKAQAFATGSAGAERIHGTPLIQKAHVSPYTRQTKGGQTVQVGEYDTTRPGAQPKPPGPGRPPAAAPMPTPRAPAAAVPAPTPRVPGAPPAPVAAPAAPPGEPAEAVKPHSIDELAKHIAEFVPIAQEATERLAAVFPGLPVGYRMKAPHKLDEKLSGRSGTGKPPKQLHEIEDIAGTRVTFKSIPEIQAAVERVKRNFNVRSEEDYLARPKNNYRSYHVILEVQGRPVELQLRTPRLTILADYMHDTVYKQQTGHPPPPEIHPYLAGLSEHVACLDGGGDPSTCPPAPDCPPPVQQALGCVEGI
jgi:ppGpp synthetase/RelA/SpoT-type nucleotidyltranferase